MDNKAMYKLSYGLFVLTANDNGKDNGCIINTAGQVTTDPNQITIAVNKANYTHDLVMKNRKFTVSIISQDATFELFKHFGFSSGRDVDKFKDYAYAKRALNDTMYIDKGTNAYISAYVKNTIDLGTHTLFIAQVTDAETLSDVPSATYEYYMNNIKPKPGEGKSSSGKTIWRCRICGYEYEGEELPQNFVCPICKHGASDFEKV